MIEGEIVMADNTKENIPAVPAMKLELVPVPVSDVDRAKAFYVEKAGFTLEVDTRPAARSALSNLHHLGRLVRLSLGPVCPKFLK